MSVELGSIKEKIDAAIRLTDMLRFAVKHKKGIIYIQQELYCIYKMLEEVRDRIEPPTYEWEEPIWLPGIEPKEDE